MKFRPTTEKRDVPIAVIFLVMAWLALSTSPRLRSDFKGEESSTVVWLVETAPSAESWLMYQLRTDGGKERGDTQRACRRSPTS